MGYWSLGRRHLPLFMGLALTISGCGLHNIAADVNTAHMISFPIAHITSLAINMDGVGVHVLTRPGLQHITVTQEVSPVIRASVTVKGHLFTLEDYDPSYTPNDRPLPVQVLLPPGRSVVIHTDGSAVALKGSYQNINIASQGGAVSISGLSAAACRIAAAGGPVNVDNAVAGRVLAVIDQGGPVSLRGPLDGSTTLKDQGGAVAVTGMPRNATAVRVSDPGGSVVSHWPDMVKHRHSLGGTTPGHNPRDTLTISDQGGPVVLG